MQGKFVLNQNFKQKNSMDSIFILVRISYSQEGEDQE